jgi:hypothetical protein
MSIFYSDTRDTFFYIVYTFHAETSDLHQKTQSHPQTKLIIHQQRVFIRGTRKIRRPCRDSNAEPSD